MLVMFTCSLKHQEKDHNSETEVKKVLLLFNQGLTLIFRSVLSGDCQSRVIVTFLRYVVRQQKRGWI